MKKRILMIIFCFFLGSLFLVPDDLTSKEPVKTKLKFHNGYRILNVPFEDDNNLIFIQAQINRSEQVWFLIDTGATFNVIDLTFAKQRKLDLSNKQKSLRSGREYIQLNNITISFPGMDIIDQPAKVFNIQGLLAFSGRKISGILGYDFLSTVVLKIDYYAKNISLFDPDHFKYSGKGETLPLILKDKWPLLSITVYQENSPPLKGNVIIDTGSLMAIALNRSDLARKTIDLPLSAGVNGTGEGGRLGRVQYLKIGKFKIEKPIAGFPKQKNTQSDFIASHIKKVGLGIIGSEILRRFTLTFDYKRKLLFAEANPNFNQSYDWDMSGMFIIAMGTSFKTFKVFKITSGSPAALAGIKEGDVIVAVDNQPSDRFTLSQLRDLLKKNGKKLILKIQRDNKILDIPLVLKRMI